MNRVGHIDLIDQAHQKTGITESNIGAIDSRSLERLSCFRGREGVNTVSILVDEWRISLRAELRTKFIGMVFFDPAHKGVEGRALRNLIGTSLGTDPLHSAGSVSGKKTRHGGEELVFDTSA